jgi:hypothetical protein
MRPNAFIAIATLIVGFGAIACGRREEPRQAPAAPAEAANDNGSGTALVMEVACVFSSADVQTDRSSRFALWNNEETGYEGAHAYVEQRAAFETRKVRPAPAGIRSQSGWA